MCKYTELWSWSCKRGKSQCFSPSLLLESDVANMLSKELLFRKNRSHIHEGWKWIYTWKDPGIYTHTFSSIFAILEISYRISSASPSLCVIYLQLAILFKSLFSLLFYHCEGEGQDLARGTKCLHSLCELYK